MKKLKIAAVGLGRLGWRHAENLAYHLPGVSLAGVCALEEQALLEARRSLGVEKVYREVSTMLSELDLDAIALTSPSHLHCEQIEQALEAGLHVFCEKPLGIDLEKCQQTAAVVRQHPEQVVMLGFMRRYDPSYQYAKEQIRAGAIGRPILFRGYSVDPEHAIEGAIRYAAHSAGQFLDMAVHDIDLTRWLMEAEPVRLFALGDCYAHPEFGEYGDGDNVAALMELSNGSMAFMLAGRTASHGYNVETEIIGTKGTLRIGSVPSKNMVEILDHQGVRRECSQHFLERFDTAYLHELREFVACIREGRQPEIRIEDGVEATRVALAADKAFREKRLLDLS